METRAGEIAVHYVEHGAGRPVLVLHGAGVDHREAEACFEPVFAGVAGIRRIYPDLPAMGQTRATDRLRGAEDVLDTLLDFAEAVTGGSAHLLIGHSAGAYFAQAMASRRPGQVAGLALVCPLQPGLRNVPEHRVVVGSGEIGDEDFRGYFVVQSPEMLERYERYVRPAAALVDQAALERIGERWEITPNDGPAYAGPTLVVAGRLDSTVGYAAAVDLVDYYPHVSLAVVDDAGHALPHEKPDLLRALVAEWLTRVDASGAEREPMPFEPTDSGPFFHGTKADLRPGELLQLGYGSNFGGRKRASFIYMSATLDAATWGAELAVGEGPGRIYRVEPTGPFEDDPNLTDKRFPGNPTRSYRTQDSLRVVGEVLDWEPHPPEVLQDMRDHLAELERQGIEAIND